MTVDLCAFTVSRNLNVESSRVTDCGMKMLCREESGSPGCRSIQQLSIKDTTVTGSGVETVLLEQTHLTFLDCEFFILFCALAKLSAFGPFRTFPLSRIPAARLRSDGEMLSFQRAISICNQLVITRLEIECDRESSGLTDYDAFHILSLANFDLRELIFDGLTDSSITFARGIAPVLETVGEKLRVLEIGGAENVDLSFIVTRCTSLRKLRFSYNKSYANCRLPKTETAGMAELTDFFFEASKESDDVNKYPSENHVSFILSSPLLQKLHVNCCATLSDAALAHSFRRSKFGNLSFVNISGCHSITNSGLAWFMKDENSISHLSLDNCKALTLNDFTTNGI